ncbi:hypothetical protein JHU04_001278 [Brenneria sp. 4F2]|nr:hypothetical protein [Brenneria bubanii]
MNQQRASLPGRRQSLKYSGRRQEDTRFTRVRAGVFSPAPPLDAMHAG